jgi:hypothetical protein
MDASREMLFREYDETRESARHNSTARAQYLGFAFTLMFASAAYLGSVARDGGLTHAWRAATAALVLWVVAVVSCLTFIAIAKFGRVLEHQSYVRGRIRDHFLEVDQQELVRAKEIKVTIKDPYPHPLFTVQRSAEATLELGGLLAIAGQVALAIRFSVIDASLASRIVLWLLAATSLAFALLISLRKNDFLVLAEEIEPGHPGR